MNTLILAGGSFDSQFAAEYVERHRYDCVIAVDGGLSYAKELGIKVDYIVGDFDTLTDIDTEYWENNGATIRRFEPMKDDTDSEIAIKMAVGMNSDIDILGATGRRLDHFLGNIHNLAIAAEKGLTARIIDPQNIIFLAMSDFTMNRADYPGKYVSFVPFAGEVTGLKLKGFKYPLSGYTLKPGVSRCISNEFAADSASVSFLGGSLIVINSSDVKPE